MYTIKRTYEEEAQGDAGAGGGGGQGSSQGQSQQQEGQTQGQTLGQQANTSSDHNEWLPEKFRTNKADGSGLDIDASARKLAQSYSELEKRGGPVKEGVPATAAEYMIDPARVPAGIDPATITSDPLFKSFIEDAHKEGMTNAQVNMAMERYFQIMPDVINATVAQNADAARATLTKAWGEGNLDANLAQAVRAAQAFGGAEGELGNINTIMGKYGNDPDILAFLSKVGAEIAEDTPIQGDQASMGNWQDQVNGIRMSDAYKDSNHLEHAKAVAQMQALYDKRYGTKKAFRGSNM
jgi:hypothetical protein